MTQHDIICEMYRLSVQRQEIDEKICELAKTLHERASFMRRANEKKTQAEALAEPDDDDIDDDETETETQHQNGIENNILHMIREAKKLNHKGFYSGALKRLDDTYRQAFESLVESGRIVKTRIKTNNYYVENF